MEYRMCDTPPTRDELIECAPTHRCARGHYMVLPKGAEMRCLTCCDPLVSILAEERYRLGLCFWSHFLREKARGHRGCKGYLGSELTRINVCLATGQRVYPDSPGVYTTLAETLARDS